jgi:hypothetical protein
MVFFPQLYTSYSLHRSYCNVSDKDLFERPLYGHNTIMMFELKFLFAK